MKKRMISLLLCLCMVFSLLPTAVLAADGEDPDTSAGPGQVTQQNPEDLGDQSDPDDLNDSENSDDSDAPQLLGEGGEGATTTAVPELKNPATSGTSGGIDWKVENGTLTITPSSSPESDDYTEGQMVKNYGTLSKKAPEDADYITALTEAGYTQSDKGYFYYPGTETWVSDSPWKFLSEEITKVVVKNGVTSIAARAFRLPNVTEVSIPASVTSIGNLVFEACENLTTVNWTGDWTDHVSMPFNGFSRCSSLGEGRELTEWMPACFYVNKDSDSIEGTQFTVDFGKLNKRLENDATYPRAMFRSVPKITSATLTSQLNVDYIFEYSGIQSVTIEDGQKNIATAAFRGCEGLTSVTIPASVTEIHTRAFADSGLRNITFSGLTSPKFDSFAFENVELDSLTLNDNMSLTEAVKIIGALAKDGAITDSTTIAPAKFANFDAENVVVDGKEGEAINHQSYPSVKNLTINGAYTSAIEAFGNFFWGQETLENLTIHAPGEDVTINATAFLRTPLKSVKIEAKKLTFTGDAAFLNTMYLTHIDLTGVDDIDCTAGARTFVINDTNNGNKSAPTRYVYFKNAAARSAMSSQFGGNTNTYYLVTNGGSVDATKTGFDAVYRAGYTAQWYEEGGTPVTGKPVTGKTYYVQWTKGAFGGPCGATGNEKNVYWTLAPNGNGYTLSIVGTGAMADYTCNITGSDATQPWRESMTGVAPTEITKVVVVNGVTNIGNFACDGLSQVKEYNIAASVKDIGPWGVCGQNAETYNLNGSTHYVVTDGVLMSADGETLVSYPGGKGAVDEYAIPNTVKAILAGAFVGSDAKKVIIPSSVTSFPRFSFGGSTVEEIEFNATVDTLEGGAFSGLSQLKSLVFGGTTLTTIRDQACSDLSSLTEITFPDSLTTIEDQAFKVLPEDGAAAPNLKKVTFGKGMSTIGDVVFLRQSALEVIDMTHCEELTDVGLFNSRDFDGSEETPYKNTPIVYTANADVAELVKQSNGTHLIYAVTNDGTFPADTEFEAGKLAEPKKEGCLFLGWYKSADFSGEKVNTFEAGQTYYAKWMDHIPEPTNADLAKGLVTVKCLNPVAHPTMQYGLNAAVAHNKYTMVQVSATEYSVTYDADAFAVNGHSLYSAKTLNWTLTYDGSKWNLESKTSGVDDVVLVTHAPTTLNEVTEFIDGRTDVIKTSCVNGETTMCAYGLMVAFQNPDHVVSVKQEKGSDGQPIRGSYIATLKMDQFAEAGAKACNDKSFASSPRTHDVLSKNPVQWRFKVTQAEVSTDTGAEKQYVWSAEPVTPGTDDVCQVAHRVVLTFSYDQYGVTVDNTKVEYKYNTKEITNNEVPTPTREGYTFVRWLDADGNAFDPTATVTEDHTYNSIEWKPIKYRVIFDANAGDKTVTGTMEDQTFTYDVEAKLNANKFACTDEKNGVQLYVFGGWNTAADGSGTAYTDEQEVSNLTAESEGEITLYAQWQHVTKKLTYVSAQGDAPDAADVDIFSEVIVNEAPTGYDTTKYIFKGWRSNVDGLREVFQAGDKFVMPNTDVTLTAVWEEIVPVAKYTVTYQIDSMQSEDGTYEVGSTVHVMRDNPTKSGYTFLYWRSSHEGKLLKRGDTFEMPNTNVTLTAQWQKDPTEYTVQFLVDGRLIGQETGIAGSFITLKPAQTKTGFTFVGWQSSVGEGKIYPADSRFEIPATTVKMTAVWQADPTTYTVTYALNGGEGTAPTAAQYVADAFVTVTDETFTKEGFIFAGWRSSFGGTVYQANDTFQMPGTNVTLTAQWQPVEKTYTVSTSIDGTVTQIVDGKKANEIYTIAVDDPTKDGHTFTGWLLSSTGTVVHNGDTFNMPAGNVVLTAQWEKEAESYTVTYKNGEASESAGSYKAGEWVNVKEAPAAAAGQTFKGWESNTGETYQPGKQFKMPDTNVVLTAKWIANTYTITWMGADGELMQTTVQHGETPVYSGATPTKDATVDKTYTFKGWNPEITEATEDTTYTAQFEETTRTYTVKFFNADGTLLESKQVEYGTVPKLGCTPTLEGNSQYSYTFKTWSPKLAPVTGDAEYCATYTKTVNKYTVTWIIDGDSTEETYEYGKMPAHADPVKAATDDTVYTFKGWTPALSIVTGNVTYTAQFDAITKHTVSYELAGGTPAIDSAKYAAGDVVTTPATVPTKTGYVFTGWLVSFENKTVNAYGSFTMPNTDVTLTAQWRVAITGNVYIPAMNPEHGTHEEPYSAQLTAKKDNATGDPVTAGDVQFVLVDANGHADTSRNIGHDLKLNADGSITGTANGAGEVTFRVRLANAAGDFVSDSFEFTIVIDKASRICTSVTMEDWTYGDKPNKPVVTLSKTEGTESYTYFYKVKGTDDSTYTTEVPVNAGDYTVKVVVAESANYKSCEGTADFTIHKALITSVDPVVTAPVACAAAQTTIADGNGYTGTITWTPAPVDGKFDYATEYTAAVVLTPDSNHYFAANTEAEGWSVSYDADSGKLTLTHKFEKTELGKIETPVIRPNGGRFTDRQTVKITCATEGAVIHYTTDGTTPTASSSVYDGVFTITETTTVKAIAVKEKYLDSEVASATFTKYTPRPSTGGATVIPTPSKTELKFNTADHFAYVNGYPDGTVKPTGDVTRAEVAAILYRVMDADCVKTYETTRCSFSDVVRGDWFNTYVATLENAGVIVDTRTNGKFRPNEAITRAELAAMLAQFADIKSAANSFNDVSARHWASDEIAVCAKMGWINGYPDGSFRPDATITRAEMMAMINRALDRTPKSVSDLLPGMKTWSDNTNTGAWYYLDVQEATNSHTYTKSGTHETWKKLH